MKCTECGHEMIKSVGDHIYRESGMDHVTLRNVTKHTCHHCGAQRVQIVAMGPLHRAIALAIAGKPARLIPSEVRFIRDHLELPNKDFAELMGVTPEQSSRWTTSEPVSVPAERFLRMIAVMGPEFISQRNRAAELEQRILEFLKPADLARALRQLPSKDEPVTKVPIKIRRGTSGWQSETQPLSN